MIPGSFISVDNIVVDSANTDANIVSTEIDQNIESEDANLEALSEVQERESMDDTKLDPSEKKEIITDSHDNKEIPENDGEKK